jgi:hypothetical protein
MAINQVLVSSSNNPTNNRKDRQNQPQDDRAAQDGTRGSSRIGRTFKGNTGNLNRPGEADQPRQRRRRIVVSSESDSKTAFPADSAVASDAKAFFLSSEQIEFYDRILGAQGSRLAA